MPPVRRVAALVGLAALIVAPLASAQRQRTPGSSPGSRQRGPGQPVAPGTSEPGIAPTRPTGPSVPLGALLPISSPAAWYAQDIRGGIDLALDELAPKPTRSDPAAADPAAGASETGAAAATAATPAPGTPATSPPTVSPPVPTVPPPAPGTGAGSPVSPALAGGAPGVAGTPKPAPRLQVSLETLDVQPLDLKAATADFDRLVAAGAPVVLTSSPTPSLAIYPLAAARDVLLVHLGLPTERFPAGSRTLLQVRPSVPARASVLAAYAWTRGVRRLALVASGDEFGRALRAALSARWRERGAPLVAEESLTLDGPDVRSRLTRLARQGPEAIALGFQGRELGELVRRIRETGYSGLLLGLDDDRTVLLAAGPETSNLEILADAFVPAPDTPGARFATAFEARHRRPPSRHAAAAYDVASIVGRTVLRMVDNGAAPPRKGSAVLAAILAERTFPSVFGGQLAVRDDGTFDRPLALFSVDKGKPTFLRYIGSSGRPASDR